MRILPYRRRQERRGLDAVLPPTGRSPPPPGCQKGMNSTKLHWLFRGGRGQFALIRGVCFMKILGAVVLTLLVLLPAGWQPGMTAAKSPKTETVVDGGANRGAGVNVSLRTVKIRIWRKLMSQSEQFEVLILGSGEAGKLLAWHMAGSGRRTTVVERRWIGGSCPNIACLPTKNEIWSARIAHLTKHAEQFGTMIAGAVTTDMAKVRQRKRNMVEGEIAFHLHNYQTTGGELIMGAGRFVAPKTLEVRLNDGGTRVLAADQVFLNVGTHPAIPPVPRLDAARPLTHIEALELDYLPSHLIVLGGGYVGLEMAQAYRRFGSRVTVIEAGPQLMSREDPDVADEMQRILGDEGIAFLIAAEALDVHGRSGEEISITVRTTAGEQKIAGSDILVA